VAVALVREIRIGFEFVERGVTDDAARAELAFSKSDNVIDMMV
jgi:hypothetical protein